MEHLSLEIFDLTGNGSQYATLPEDSSITITDTSEIFSTGDLWSYAFTLNVWANAHIFGSAGDIHGARLHELIDKRRARLWIDGLPMYLGYLKLDSEVEVNEEGDVEISFESGQKLFDERIEGTSAQEVSVGDVVIGVALNRKRVSIVNSTTSVQFTLDGLDPYAERDRQLKDVAEYTFDYGQEKSYGRLGGKTPYVQRWPKLVKSHGEILDSTGAAISPMPDYTNIQTPYDAGHPFCNINICYPLKVKVGDEEKAARGYTLRLARGKDGTTDGSDNQTRFNNSPNFYLLYFIDRLFKDLNIYVEENQAKDVEDLRRVFMLNYGCFYEEIEDTYQADEMDSHNTPRAQIDRYGQYYMPIIRADDKLSLIKGWAGAGQYAFTDKKGLDYCGKVLLRNVQITKDGNTTLLSVGSLEGIVQSVKMQSSDGSYISSKRALQIDKSAIESPDSNKTGSYSAYLAYATGENYPKVEISEIIEAMKSMFGVRFLFSKDYKRVRIVLLRNIFRDKDVQELTCDIIGETKEENNIRGFRMTYGQGKENTSFYYKGFADMLQREPTTWKDTTDKHDYSQWDLDAEYGEVKQYVSAFNRKCYVTPVTGNAYGTQVDEDEDVLFPSLFEWAGYMDAEDGDCSGEKDTIYEVQCGATPVIMNEVGTAYASLFSGDLKAPAPDIKGSNSAQIEDYWDEYAAWLTTYGRVTPDSVPVSYSIGNTTITGNLDIYIAEGFRMRMLDNYAISNGGTPFDEAEPGLQFGIMRGSGAYAHINYSEDEIEDEGNDYWEVVPGAGAIDHPDTCDPYGNLWDYDGGDTDTVRTASEAEEELRKLFPYSNAPFHLSNGDYITKARIFPIKTFGAYCYFLMVENYGEGDDNLLTQDYTAWLANYPEGHSVNEMIYMDADVSKGGRQLIVEADSNNERLATLLDLCKKAYGEPSSPDITIDNGISSRYGRFSLKLRAEKPNPMYDPTQETSSDNRRYLSVTNENLKRRGLCDQFYKEYSYWVRNARIAKLKVRMELAQLLSIDKTKRVTIGDITGFIRKMQYNVSSKTGLGMVEIEMLYI